MALSLHHLYMQSPDPDALSRFYAAALCMDRKLLGESGGWLCRGPARTVLIGPGARGTLGFAAYTSRSGDDLGALRRRIEEALVRVEDSPSPLLIDEAFAIRDPDGNCLAFGLQPDCAASSARDALPARLQHFVVASTDCARMAGFYAGVLGFTVSDRVVDDDGSLRACFLRSDDEHHSFAVFQASDCRLDHHCYEAGEWGLIRDWADRLASLRVPIAWGPGRHGPGNNLFIFIHDPDGNWLEISAELEVVAPDRPAGVWPHEERTLNSWGSAPLRS
jgi:catechol 2,3-dioxygenase-like lactoylglutathione lyase family enzyme